MIDFRIQNRLRDASFSPAIPHLKRSLYHQGLGDSQLKALGAVVSANPYYQSILSDVLSDEWLGSDRGKQMVLLGSLARLGVPFGLHSDAPMAAFDPLTLAWTWDGKTRYA